MNDNPVLRELQSVKVILKGKDSEGERGCLPWISKAKGGGGKILMPSMVKALNILWNYLTQNLSYRVSQIEFTIIMTNTESAAEGRVALCE